MPLPPPPAQSSSSGQRVGSLKLPSNFQIPSYANSNTPLAMKGVTAASSSSSSSSSTSNEYNVSSASFMSEFLVGVSNPPPVFGHGHAKKFLKESIIIPLLYPTMPSWKGVLLFGPAGVGKSSLIKSVVSEVNEKYLDRLRLHIFSCSASGIVNKYRGESEKILKGVFEAAREIKGNDPSPAAEGDDSIAKEKLDISIIFIDELDSIFSSSANDESSSRLRVELLKHIDGVEAVSGKGKNRVIVVGATNCPWDLGDALIRRFEKRCYIALPSVEDRRSIIAYHLEGLPIDDDVDLESTVKRTEGLSGADLMVLCREAAMGPLRRFLVGVSPKDFTKEDLAEIKPDILGPVEGDDFERAVKNTSRTVGDVTKLQEFDAYFGSR